jgi:c(7)-type cytochrome triheme protein
MMQSGRNLFGLRGVAMIVAMVLLPTILYGQQDNRKWDTLERDKNHDPELAAVQLKQQPEEAMRPLPHDYAGNKVRWVEALRGGHIEPRAKLYPSTEVQLLDLDILFVDTAGMPYVLFPHKRHTEWLDCSNCHESFFKKVAGTTPVNMFSILMGEHCGRCHGAVSFPLTECNRCHSVPQNVALMRRGREFTQPDLAPLQDSEQIVIARPPNDPLFQNQPKGAGQ